MRKICLAGNPNVGKSSLFNTLTGLKQHTGNWPGKTVDNLLGKFSFKSNEFNLVDLPGIYSLYGASSDEIIARDYLCFNQLDCVVVVADPFSFEKSLNLLFQILEYHKNVIFVVNLIDEATNKGIIINKLSLMYYLGIPVVFTSCKNNFGILELKETILEVVENRFKYNTIEINYDLALPNCIVENDMFYSETTLKRLIDSDQHFIESINRFGDTKLKRDFINFVDNKEYEKNRKIITEENFKKADYIKQNCIKYTKDPLKKDKKIDSILTNKLFGIPIMILLLSLILYLTISFANIPSTLLFDLFFYIEEYIIKCFNYLNINSFITDFLVLGIYRTTAWVVSVMLPPMAIFFPLFTFLEDLGYLPRVAYNLDYFFKKSNCHGKQSLSMCMGFGCNAAGVAQTRIIDSPKGKLIAIITNTFTPCNGRFPTFILISTLFFTITSFNNLFQASVICSFICFGVLITLLVSKFLSLVLFKNKEETFTLELPPYRKPNLLRIIQRSIIERTLKLLVRAVKVSAVFGAVIFILANIMINDNNILYYLSNFLNPLGQLLGLDGVILLAFILALPANEILIPLLIMIYTNTTYITDFESINSLKDLLVQNNWTIITAINILLFSLLHFPCATTLLTIKKETNSWKYTFLSFVIPTLVSIIVCFISNILLNIII